MQQTTILHLHQVFLTRQSEIYSFICISIQHNESVDIARPICLYIDASIINFEKVSIPDILVSSQYFQIHLNFILQY